MIHQLDVFGKELVQTSIERLKAFEPKEGYYLAFSGGKDSVVCKALCDMAGVKYDAHYSVTSVDPPELVRFIKENHPDVSFDIPHWDKDGLFVTEGRPITMWNLIPEKTMPPTRLVRYCCAFLKETGGMGRKVVTGVRWAESARRKNSHGVVTILQKAEEVSKLAEEAGIDIFKNSQGGVVLNNDNTESRKLVDVCYKEAKTTINPIIDWTDSDVWEFIHEYNIPYCKLYDEGYKRLGCIGCPMSGHNAEELEKFPKYKNLYLKAFEKMVEARKIKGLNCAWNTAEEVMNWWLKVDKE